MSSMLQLLTSHQGKISSHSHCSAKHEKSDNGKVTKAHLLNRRAQLWAVTCMKTNWFKRTISLTFTDGDRSSSQEDKPAGCLRSTESLRISASFPS